MITYEQFEKVMSFDTRGCCCIEIEFYVKGSEKFDGCWMGKMPDEKAKADLYWFGLTADGKNAYDYATFDEMACAKIFDGKSFSDIWDDIEFFSVDGLDPMERFLSYLKNEGPFIGAAQW